MNKRLTKTEMMAYLNRWEMVNKKEVELLQKTPYSTKFKQFLSLMASVHLLFGMRASKRKVNKADYQLWQNIRRKMNCA